MFLLFINLTAFRMHFNLFYKESMDEAEPSSIGVPVAESTLALWDEMNVLQVSVSYYFI